MAKKKVLFASPNDWNLNKLIEKELKKMGCRVASITVGYKANPITLFEKGKIIIREIFGNKQYRNKIVTERIRKSMIKKIESNDNYDVCFVILPFYFSHEILSLMRQKAVMMFAYNYDGVDRYDTTLDKVKYFDDFYVFDDNDVIKYPEYNLKKASNFYFKELVLPTSDFDFDFYFIGGYNEMRNANLESIAEYFDKNNISYKIEIHFDDENEYQVERIYEYKTITPFSELIPYAEYLEKMKRSRYILDMLIDAHSGLSFRIIESLWYKKKVVTNNKTVKNYDFYSPENIFILDERPLSELKDFLRSDYKEIDPSIVEKYSFEYWFNEKIGKM